MDNIFAIMVGSFAIAFSGAASPGPVLTITISESSKRGFKVGPLIVLGHALLEIPVVVGIMFGMAEFLKDKNISVAIASAGSVILFYLAWVTYKDSLNYSFNKSEETTTIKCWWDLPLKGILTSLSNPYWFIWWATIGLAYMSLAMKLGMKGIIAFYIAHIAADFVWYAFVSALIASGRSFIKDFVYRWILKGCAFALFVFGVYFAFNAISVIVRGL